MFPKTFKTRFKHNKTKHFKNVLTFGTSILLAYSIFITPAFPQEISTDGKTNTTINFNGNITDISTSTIKGINAFNSFNTFNVSQGNVVNLHVPTQADNLINLINNQTSTINGVVNSIKDNHIAGNVFFLNPYGFIINSQGVINTGSLTIITPQKSYMNDFFTNNNEINDTSVEMLLNNQVPINTIAPVANSGQINSSLNVNITAGNVINSGQINSSASFIENNISIGDVVNIHNINNAESIVNQAGTISIVASNNVVNSGILFSDGSKDANAGNINITAEDNITLSENSILSATGQTENSNGGFINLSAQQNINFLNNPIISASGSRINGNASNVKITAGHSVNFDQATFLLNSSNDVNGEIIVDPIFVNIKNLNTFGANITIYASNSINFLENSFLSSTNHLNNGKSGNIELNAPNINLANNTAISSLANNGFESGIIKLISNDINTGNDLPSISIDSGNNQTLFSRQTPGDIIVGRTDPLNLPLWTRDNALWISSDFVNSINSNNIVFGTDPLTNDLAEYVVLSDNFQRTGDVTLSGNYRSAIWDDSNININGNLNLFSKDRSLILNNTNINVSQNLNLISDNISVIANNSNITSNNILMEGNIVVGTGLNTFVHALNDFKVISDEFIISLSNSNSSVTADNKAVISRKTFGNINISNQFGQNNIFKADLSKINTPLLIFGNTADTNNNTNQIFINSTDSTLEFKNDISFIAPQLTYYGSIHSTGNILIKTDYLYDGVYNSPLLGKIFDLLGPSTNIKSDGFINIQKLTPGIINISNFDSLSSNILNLFPMSLDKLNSNLLIIGDPNNLNSSSLSIDNSFSRNGSLDLYGNIINIGFDNNQLLDINISKDFSIHSNVTSIANKLITGNLANVNISSGGNFNINSSRSLFVGQDNSGLIELSSANDINFNAPNIIIFGQDNKGTINTLSENTTNLKSDWIYLGFNNSGNINFTSGQNGFNIDSFALIADNKSELNTLGHLNINTNDIYLFPQATMESSTIQFTRKDPGQIIISPLQKIADTNDSILDITSTELSQIHSNALFIGDPNKINNNIDLVNIGGTIENFNELFVFTPEFNVLPDTYIYAPKQIYITADSINIDTTSIDTKLLTGDLTLARYSIGDILIGPNGFITPEELSKINFTGFTAGNNPSNSNTDNLTNLVNFSLFNNLSLSSLGNTTIADNIFLGAYNVTLDGINVNIGDNVEILAQKDLRIISNDISITNNSNTTYLDAQNLFIGRKTYGNLEISPTGVISTQDWNSIFVDELFLGNHIKTTNNTDNVFVKESLFAPGDINISSYFDTVLDPNVQLKARNIFIDGDIVELNNKSSLDAFNEIIIQANLLNTNGNPNLIGDSFIFSRHTPGNLLFSSDDLNYFAFNFITFGNSSTTNNFTNNIDFIGENLIFRPNTVINALNEVRLTANKISVNTTSPINKINANTLIINRFSDGDISIAPNGTISQDELDRFIVSNLRIGNFGNNPFNTDNVNFSASQFFPGNIYIAANNSIHFDDNALLISDNDINIASPSISIGLNSLLKSKTAINSIANDIIIDTNSIYPAIESANFRFGRLSQGNIEISNNGTLSPQESELIFSNLLLGNSQFTSDKTDNIIFNDNSLFYQDIAAISNDNIFVNNNITSPTIIYLNSNQVTINKGASLNADSIIIESPKTILHPNTSINSSSDLILASDSIDFKKPDSSENSSLINANNRIFVDRFTKGDILVASENDLGQITYNNNSLILDPANIVNFSTKHIYLGDTNITNSFSDNIILAGQLNLNNDISLFSNNNILIQNVPNNPIPPDNINLFAKNIDLVTSNLQFGKDTTVKAKNKITLIADTFTFDPTSSQGGIFTDGDVILSRKTPGNFAITNDVNNNDVFKFLKFTKNQPFTLMNIADINNINCNLFIGNTIYSNSNINDILIASNINRTTGSIALIANNNIDLYSSSNIHSISNILINAGNYVYIDGTASLVAQNIDISGLNRVFIADNSRIIANNDINIFSYNVNALGNPLIQAGNNISIASILSTSIADSAVFRAAGNINLNGSLIFISNNSNISADRDINIFSNDYTAITGNSNINAGRDLFLSSGNYISLFDAAALTSGREFGISFVNTDFSGNLSDFVSYKDSKQQLSDGDDSNASDEDKEKIATEALETNNDQANIVNDVTINELLNDKNIDEKLKNSVGFDLIDNHMLEGFDIHTEIEADLNGVDFASKLNYKPQGLRDFLRTVKNIEDLINKDKSKDEKKASDSKSNSFLGYLHPKTEERIEKIDKKIDKDNLNDDTKKSFDKKYRKILKLLNDR